MRMILLGLYAALGNRVRGSSLSCVAKVGNVNAQGSKMSGEKPLHACMEVWEMGISPQNCCTISSSLPLHHGDDKL
jgi:hypothetical protein